MCFRETLSDSVPAPELVFSGCDGEHCPPPPPNAPSTRSFGKQGKLSSVSSSAKLSLASGTTTFIHLPSNEVTVDVSFAVAVFTDTPSPALCVQDCCWLLFSTGLKKKEKRKWPHRRSTFSKYEPHKQVFPVTLTKLLSQFGVSLLFLTTLGCWEMSASLTGADP